MFLKPIVPQKKAADTPTTNTEITLLPEKVISLADGAEYATSDLLVTRPITRLEGLTNQADATQLEGTVVNPKGAYLHGKSGLFPIPVVESVIKPHTVYASPDESKPSGKAMVLTDYTRAVDLMVYNMLTKGRETAVVPSILGAIDAVEAVIGQIAKSDLRNTYRTGYQGMSTECNQLDPGDHGVTPRVAKDLAIALAGSTRPEDREIFTAITQHADLWDVKNALVDLQGLEQALERATPTQRLLLVPKVEGERARLVRLVRESAWELVEAMDGMPAHFWRHPVISPRGILGGRMRVVWGQTPWHTEHAKTVFGRNGDLKGHQKGDNDGDLLHGCPKAGGWVSPNKPITLELPPVMVPEHELCFGYQVKGEKYTPVEVLLEVERDPEQLLKLYTNMVLGACTKSYIGILCNGQWDMAKLAEEMRDEDGNPVFDNATMSAFAAFIDSNELVFDARKGDTTDNQLAAFGMFLNAVMGNAEMNFQLLRDAQFNEEGIVALERFVAEVN